MGTLEQIKKLESKVEKIIELIKALRAENSALKQDLDESKKREQELEKKVSSLKNGNEEFKNGIAYAIELLDEIENQQPDLNTSDASSKINMEFQKNFSELSSDSGESGLKIDMNEEDEKKEESSKEQLDIF